MFAMMLGGLRHTGAELSAVIVGEDENIVLDNRRNQLGLSKKEEA